MRNISAALQSHLNGGTLTVAKLVKITRTDGVTLGFTDTDTHITFGGLTYYATDGVGSSAVQSSTGTGVDNMEIMGALTSSRITDDDLAAGRYDGAAISVMLVNRLDLTQGSVNLLTGYLGEVQIIDGEYKVEVRSLTQLLKQATGDTTSPTCRCRRLGDLQCKVNLAGNTTAGVAIAASRTVSAVSADGLTITFASDSAPSDHYRDGVVQFTTGANANLARDVRSHILASGAAVLVMREGFPLAVAVGDVATIQAGCDGVFATCRDKFANANNFHGEHQLPTNDVIQQTGRPPQ